MKNSIRHLIAGMSLLIPAVSLAIPARPVAITITQPDGSEVSIIKRGDERGHSIYTDDGYLLKELSDGTYVYATIDHEGNLAPSVRTARSSRFRSEEDREFLRSLDRKTLEAAENARLSELRMAKAKSNNRLPRLNNIRTSSDAGDNYTSKKESGSLPGLATQPKPFPNRGERRSLVVVVEYNDVKFKLEDPKQHFDALLNQENYSEYGATGSARDWFISNSRGLFTPIFDVYGPITLPENMSYYGSNDRWGNDKAPEMMAVHALQALDDVVDFSIYDTNGDGDIDNVYVFYAGYGENDGGRSSSVWPHSYDVTEVHEEDFIFDGVRVNHYACSNELTSRDRYDGIGTFVHEFSHVLGLPDLYHTSAESTVTPGEYSVLDGGPYNNESRTPPNYSIYERSALGWMQPEVFKGSGDYTLKNIAESNHGYIIHTDKENEFYLFENRQLNGWDKYIPGHGMLIWHIDYDEEIWNDNTVNNTNNHQCVDIVEADGRTGSYNAHSDTWPGTLGITEFGPETYPALKAWDSTPLPYYFTNITETGGDITFHLEAPEIPDDPGNNDDPGDNEGIDYTKAEQSIIVRNGHVYSAYDSTCEVYDLSGRKIATIPAYGEAFFESGMYIIKTPVSTVKIKI